MIKIIIGIFMMLHGLVYLIYLGHSRQVYELQPGLTWPDNAWILSTFLNNDAIRLLASISYAFVALGFVMSGIGLMASQAWYRTCAISAASAASIMFIFFWDGTLQKLDGQGAIGVIINIVLIIALVAQIPALSFS